MATAQSQFGRNAEKYATSHVHAKGASLKRLVELVRPEASWRVLDIATGAGHTAFVFAPHVARVVASDITPEMLEVTAKLAAERGIQNVSTELADALHLPFADGAFELVTCRIAPHHFADIGRFLQEARRVLVAGGTLAIVDNVVPEGEAGAEINAFEKLRDPSHVRCLSVGEWQAALQAAGFEVAAVETAPKAMEFDAWADRMGATPETVEVLRAWVRNASGEVGAFFDARVVEGELWFNLEEAILVAR